MKETCLRCRTQILSEENGDIIRKILIRPKELKRNRMKKKLKWKKEMEGNRLMGIISRIENIKKAKIQIETLEEGLDQKMILIQASRI
jgi:uncharacterized protein YktB (UPF0637 family)